MTLTRDCLCPLVLTRGSDQVRAVGQYIWAVHYGGSTLWGQYTIGAVQWCGRTMWQYTGAVHGRMLVEAAEQGSSMGGSCGGSMWLA
jgi:hypothetical protein